MPLYELYCENCGATKEQFLKLDESEPVCECGQQMKKAMSAPAFHLLGKNWARDNYGLKKEKKIKGAKNDK